MNPSFSTIAARTCRSYTEVLNWQYSSAFFVPVDCRCRTEQCNLPIYMHDSNETYVHNVLAKTRMMPATTTMVTSAPPSGVVVGWGFVVGVADSVYECVK